MPPTPPALFDPDLLARRRARALEIGGADFLHAAVAEEITDRLCEVNREFTAPAVVTPVALILQFISGVFFVFTSLPSWMQNVAALFPLKWLCQGLRAVFLPASFGAQEPGGSFNLPMVALVLGLWCVLALALCLTTFRWTTKRDG